MKNNGKGGMQTFSPGYAIICRVCGKPAARMEQRGNIDRFMHYTKKGQPGIYAQGKGR